MGVLSVWGGIFFVCGGGTEMFLFSPLKEILLWGGGTSREWRWCFLVVEEGGFLSFVV